MRPVISFLFAVVLATLPAAGSADGRITVTGTGEVARAPDMASLSLGSAAEAPTAADAMDQVARAIDGTLAALVEAGVAREDIQTRRLDLRPVYPDRDRNREQGPMAFRVESGLSVIVRDLDILGAVIDEVVSRGANVFGGLSFGLQNPVPAHEAALAAAVQDARRKADVMTEAAGVRLGELQTLREQGADTGPMPMAEFSVARDAMPVAEGQVTVSARVTMEWEIEDRD